MNRKQRKAAGILALVDRLAEQFPNCFSVWERRRRPLRIGIFDDLVATGAMAPAQISLALKFYTANAGYCRALQAGADRIDLHGQPAGKVIVDDAVHAAERLQQLVKRRNGSAKPANSPATNAFVSVIKPNNPMNDARAARVARVSLADLKAAALAKWQIKAPATPPVAGADFEPAAVPAARTLCDGRVH
jgi:ProP effector